MLSGVPRGLPRDTEGPSDPDHWLLLTHNGLDNDTDIDEDGEYEEDRAYDDDDEEEVEDKDKCSDVIRECLLEWFSLE